MVETSSKYVSLNVELEPVLSKLNARLNLSESPKLILTIRNIEDFMVAEDILVVGQTRQNLQWMYGKNRDFDAQ